jgi:hypothetical protein
MAKIKVTKKAMKESYDTILSIGYCHLQNLLKYENEIAYSTRSEGWACDYYEVNNVCISTGYAPIGKSINYELTKKYDTEAEKIACDYSMTWQEQKERIHELLIQFVNEAIAK